MSVYRIHKTKDFTVMSNFHLKDRSLSLKSKGLLSLMLSLPDDWNYSSEGLAELSSDGISSVKSSLRELESSNYLIRSQATSSIGTFTGYIYDIYEVPQDGNPMVDEPSAENQSTENQLQYNTNIINDYNSSPINSPTNNNLIKKLNTKNNKKDKKELDLSFVSIHFEDVFNKWLQYKKEKKQSYTQSGAEACYHKLIELSNNDPATAEKIVEQSMANNYQGLFSLKQNGNKQQSTMSAGQVLSSYLESVGFRAM